MKSVPALFLGLLIAFPAFGDCVSGQGAVINANIGIDGTFGAQGSCTPGDPGQPGSLIGFAFRLTPCQPVYVKRVDIQFQVAQAGDQYHHYLWRDFGGIPNDACGLECGVADNPVTITANGPTLQTYQWSEQGICCELPNNETFYVGVVYANVTNPADWRIGRNNVPGFVGNGFRNTTGNHGDWVELSTVGFGNRFGIQAFMGPECIVPVEDTTWGLVKSLYQ